MRWGLWGAEAWECGVAAGSKLPTLPKTTLLFSPGRCSCSPWLGLMGLRFFCSVNKGSSRHGAYLL